MQLELSLSCGLNCMFVCPETIIIRGAPAVGWYCLAQINMVVADVLKTSQTPCWIDHDLYPVAIFGSGNGLRLLGVNLLSKTMLTYGILKPQDHTWTKFYQNTKILIQGNAVENMVCKTGFHILTQHPPPPSPPHMCRLTGSSLI